MSLSEGQLAALSELEQLWPDAEAVVIGATALVRAQVERHMPPIRDR
jgi:hypothetical protein